MNDGFAEGYAIGQGNNNSRDGMGWGGEWIWIIVLFALFGWGGNGAWGGNGNGGGQQMGYDIGKLATTNDVAGGFASSATLGGLNDIKLGQAGIQQSLCQGFNGVNTAILTSANQTNMGIANLGYEMQNCCCQTQRAIDSVNYNMATNTCAIQQSICNSTRDIIDGQRESTNAILGFLTNEKISSLQAQNAQLTAQLSQNAQTNTIINTLRPVASPAYITCSPYESAFGRNGGGCGCGCGC
jgi:hypothetical protein